jgi:hypothetical protein
MASNANAYLEKCALARSARVLQTTTGKHHEVIALATFIFRFNNLEIQPSGLEIVT